MSLILLKLPNTKSIPDGRPKNCPYCGGQILQRWGRVSKPVTNRSDLMAIIYRYKCRTCNKTFRHYPKDVNRSGFSTSIRHLAVLLSAMGLSSRKTQEIFHSYGINVSHMTIWREAQVLKLHLDGQHIGSLNTEIDFNKDSNHNSQGSPPLFLALDLGEEKYLFLGTFYDSNPTSVLSWLRPLLNEGNINAVQINKDNLYTPYFPPQFS